ncbi:hypothetical protein [Arsenicicoccus dermatophilus]|uniref:hypothetical protein n=1 Tax=Arsenicicoccus dermatophilus TaxID=1076331 RepID=UPI003916E958
MSSSRPIGRRSLLVLAGVGALAGCSQRGPGAPASTGAGGTFGSFGAPAETTGAGLEGTDAAVALSKQISAALRTADRALLLRSFAPAAQPVAGRWFDAVRSVPMTMHGVVPVSGVDGEEPPAPGKPWVFAYLHQVKGLDGALSEEWYAAPLVRHGSDTVLGAWTGVRDEDPRSRQRYLGAYPQLWDEGPVRYTAGRGMGLLTPAAWSAARCRTALHALEPGVLRTTQLLREGGVRLPAGEGLLVGIVDGEHGRFMDYLGGVRTTPQADFGAATVPLLARDQLHQPLGDGQVSASRILVPADVFAEDDDEAQATIRHESVHALLARLWGASDPTARWTVEGMSQWAELDGDADLEEGILTDAADAFPARIKAADDVDFWTGDDPAVRDAYAVAYAAFAFAVDRKGLAAALEATRRATSSGHGGVYAPLGFDNGPEFDKALVAWLAERT